MKIQNDTDQAVDWDLSTGDPEAGIVNSGSLRAHKGTSAPVTTSETISFTQSGAELASASVDSSTSKAKLEARSSGGFKVKTS